VDWQAIELGRLREREKTFVNPTTGGDLRPSGSDGYAIPDYGRSAWERDKGNLVCFWHCLAEDEAGLKAGTCGQTPLIYDDSDVVRGMGLNITRSGIALH
jgi:hypothetical protein